MSFPTLFVGYSELDASLTEKCAQAASAGISRRSLAEELGCSARSLGDACKRHARRREFVLYIANGEGRTRVCHVITAASFVDVSIAAFKAYKGSLQRLSIPGWKLTDGEHSIAVVDLQRALMSGKLVAPKAKAESRARLGLKVAA